MGCRESLEPTVVRLYREKRWAESMDLLNPTLDGNDGADRAWAHLWLSIVMYAEVPAASLRALRHVNKALQIQDAEHRTLMMAFLQGMCLCNYLEDYDAAIRYAESATALCRSNSVLQEWNGRLQYQRALILANIAEFALDKAKPKKAANAYSAARLHAEKATEWYRDNRGPWDADDDRCQIRFAQTLLADIKWAHGDRIGAMADLGPVKSELVADSTSAVYEYWKGRCAMFDGNKTEAVDWFRAALDKVVCLQLSDHYMTRRIRKGLAEALVDLGDAQAASTVIEPLLKEAARVENVGLILDLHRLRKQIIGRNAHETEVSVSDWFDGRTGPLGCH